MAQDKAICHCNFAFESRETISNGIDYLRHRYRYSSGNYLASSKGAYLTRIWSAARCLVSTEKRRCVHRDPVHCSTVYETVNVNVTITRYYLENKSVRDEDIRWWSRNGMRRDECPHDVSAFSKRSLYGSIIDMRKHKERFLCNCFPSLLNIFLPN